MLRRSIVTAAAALLAACAPIVRPVVTSVTVPDEDTAESGVRAESPAPFGMLTPGDPATDADLGWLRETGLMMPVRGVSAAKLTDSFNAGRSGGRAHEALDILAPRGTPVVAATDGAVLRVGTNKLGGNVVWMADSGRRFAYYYAHLDRSAKGLKAGDMLTRGAVIGYVGTTGNAPRNVPHLHFQVLRMGNSTQWWNGTPVNPLAFIVDAPVAAQSGQPR